MNIQLGSLLRYIYTGDIKHDIVRDVMRYIAGIILPYFLTLANRNDPNSVAPPKVAKASK
jgi:hypothetical protein